MALGTFLFENRAEAGQKLARCLQSLQFQARRDTRVVALPRGGVPVAEPLARLLSAPLDVLVVKKIGAPENPEYGIGAVVEGPPGQPQFQLSSAETQEILRRIRVYREGRPFPSVRGKEIILVDDGLATGITALVAVRRLREWGADRIILAVPVGSSSALERLRPEVDELICLETPFGFSSVGEWYRDFSQVTDREVVEILRGFFGTLVIPPHSRGVVIFAHGSGSSRYSPRNQYVAARLREAGLGTMLFDLLRPEEARHRDAVFDIRLLSERLLSAAHWVQGAQEAMRLPLGFFGASTGAAAALVAAVREPDLVSGVVSRGGRPDLAESILGPFGLKKVRAKTLLILGGEDRDLLELTHRAASQIPHATEVVIPGASHLFEEEGALERVAELAADWFLSLLPQSGQAA